MQLEEKQTPVRSLQKGKGISSKPAALFSNNKMKNDHTSTESGSESDVFF
jgi:hypothetical protein